MFLTNHMELAAATIAAINFSQVKPVAWDSFVPPFPVLECKLVGDLAPSHAVNQKAKMEPPKMKTGL